MERIEVVAEITDEGKRVDAFVAETCNISRSVAQQWIEQGCVFIGGSKAVKGNRLTCGDVFEIEIPNVQDSHVEAENIPLNIVYEDSYLLVVDKSKGMVVHPAPGNPRGTMVNALMYHCGESLSGIGGEIRPGIVHRIDKNTGGLLVVAKDDKTHNALSEQFVLHSIERVYDAVVYGNLRDAEGTIDAPIGRDPKDRKKMTVIQKNAKTAVTHYQVVDEYREFSHVRLRLETGRTHQIRVHMSHIGHPVAGDEVYGPKKVIKSLGGQCLHAGVLGFVHPASGKNMHFESALPEYFTGFVSKLPKL